MYWMADVIAIIVEGVIPQCSILQQLADVGAKWQLELPPQGVFVNTGRCYLPGDRWIITAIGWCYCQVADGIGTGSNYFSLSYWGVEQKPTHTDLYLQWGSNHTVSSKYSVVGSSHHRAKTFCSSHELLQQEEDHLKQALTRCRYPAWAINKIKTKTKATANKTSRGQKNSANNIQKPHMVIPYYKGISESLQNTCRKHGVKVYFKGGNTIKNLLVPPKDQDTIQKKWSHL